MYPHHRFIQSYTHGGRIGVLVELGLETWVITQQAEFLELSRQLAMHIAAANPSSLDVLLRQQYVWDPDNTVKTALMEASTRLGERITITRFHRWDTKPDRPPEPPVSPDDPAVAIRLKRA